MFFFLNYAIKKQQLLARLITLGIGEIGQGSTPRICSARPQMTGNGSLLVVCGVVSGHNTESLSVDHSV